MPTRRKRSPAPPGRALVRLGRRIKEVRERAGMTQTELGGRYVTRSGVSRIELGLSGPSFVTLAHFARRLKVRVRALIPPGL